MPSIVANNDESKLTEFDFRRYVDFHLLNLDFEIKEELETLIRFAGFSVFVSTFKLG